MQKRFAAERNVARADLGASRGFQARADGLAVSEGVEPLVERDGRLAVVALEVVVVQVMEVRAAVQHAVKPAVAAGRRQRRVLRVEEKVQRVARNHEVYEHHREVEKVLHRVHGQTGPRARVLVEVMQILRVPNTIRGYRMNA